MATRASRRVMVGWYPDWPIVAAQRSQSIPATAPLAIVDRATVVACSPQARRAGVRRALRVREAQLRCPELVLLPYDPIADRRAFESIVIAIEERIPDVQVLQPGLCAIWARGADRYYGGENAAAQILLDSTADQAIKPRVGVADTIFAAEQAAYQTTERNRISIVPSGSSPEFLAALPITLLDEPQLVPLLMRLGIQTLGDFAALPAESVRAQFGVVGERAQLCAGGKDPRPVTGRIPPKNLDRGIEFEPALDRIDQIAFGFRVSAAEFIAGLTAAGLVCTSITVTVTDESGTVSEREWGHPRHFTAADVVDRIRWQLQNGETNSGIAAPIVKVWVSPSQVDAIGNHELGLWGNGPDERIHHVLSRLQSMLGRESVATGTIGGGRFLAERRVLVPWGDTPPTATRTATGRPWPGRLPGLQPSTVFTSLHPVRLLDIAEQPISISPRGTLTHPPSWFSPDEGTARRKVAAWAGPWPVLERWWDTDRGRRADRFQIVDDTGDAWLLVRENDRWWAEAHYS